MFDVMHLVRVFLLFCVLLLTTTIVGAKVIMRNKFDVIHLVGRCMLFCVSLCALMVVGDDMIIHENYLQ